MKPILVVFDSVFGNTEKVARSIAGAFTPQSDVEVMTVAQIKTLTLSNLKLLIVGSPTRQFRATPEITAWLESLPANSLKGVKVAAFDTRLPERTFKKNIFLRLFAKMVAYAADPIAKALSAKGGTLGVPPEGFFVEESEGPLVEGELQRAQAWAKNLDFS